MTNAKHTPGPWRIETKEQREYTHLYIVHESPTLSQIVADLHNPSRVYTDGSKALNENKMANAKLIATAPELLEVAKLIHHACRVQSNLLSTATQEERNKFISRIYEICNDFAYPAIAKAESNSNGFTESANLPQE